MLDATIENIDVVTDFVNEELSKLNCSDDTQAQIDIAIDEIFGNIANYAYDEVVGMAEVSFEIIEDNMVCLTFKDCGREYNPLEKEDPDISLSEEERNIGGLGIFIVKQTMDEVLYEYKEGHNILKIKKRVI